MGHPSGLATAAPPSMGLAARPPDTRARKEQGQQRHHRRDLCLCLHEQHSLPEECRRFARRLCKGTQRKTPGTTFAAIPRVQLGTKPIEALFEPPPHRPSGHSLPARYLDWLESLLAPEQDRRPVGLVELAHECRQQAQEFVTLEQCLGVRQRFVDSASDACPADAPGVVSGRPCSHAREVPQDRGQPRTRRASRIRRVSQSGQPGVLDRVLGAIRVPHQLAGEASKPRGLRQQVGRIQGWIRGAHRPARLHMRDLGRRWGAPIERQRSPLRGGVPYGPAITNALMIESPGMLVSPVGPQV
jgi:hypothetical protein